MRIRPAVVTISGTIIALAAAAIVVFATTPSEAGEWLVRLLWTAIFLAAWGFIATILLFVRQSTAQAVWVGIWPAVAGVGLLMARKAGYHSQQLLLGVILATLAVSIFFWWKLRRTH